MENLRKKIKRMVFVFCTIFFAMASVVFLFITISSSAAAKLSNPADNLTRQSTDLHWKILTDMQSARGDPGVVEHNNKIHVISGFFTNGVGYSNSQEIYDPETDTYEIRWGVPVPRSDMMVASINDKIYFMGGYREDYEDCRTIDFNHMYDPIMDTWITKTSMITSVSGAGVVVFSDTVQIIGGYNCTSQKAVKSVQIYDPEMDSWTLGTPLPVGRSELGAVVLDGMIYAIGGNSSNDIYTNPTTNIVEMYDPASDSWQTQPPLPEPRAFMATTVRDGKIFVIGGTDNSDTTNVVDTTFVYDPVAGIWSASTPIPTARRFCEGAEVGKKIYVVGGKGEIGAGKANEAYGFEPVTTTITITSDDPDPSQVNQLFTVSYSVTSADGIPTGIVATTIDNSDQQCVLPIVDGKGSCELSLDAAGDYTIITQYSSDEIYLPSSDSESHTIIKPPEPIQPKLYLPIITN